MWDRDEKEQGRNGTGKKRNRQETEQDRKGTGKKRNRQEEEGIVKIFVLVSASLSNFKYKFMNLEGCTIHCENQFHFVQQLNRENNVNKVDFIFPNLCECSKFAFIS